ncbi:MAG: 3-methyl-2-oxobutanoate hydroxymethyltransferase, partial [Acidimicrobiaceae bacterium]|nr:3-methyl-2-oxobutanoate hydroxymethyltransferase [Acidimicrobiaceae bacterium]
GIAGISAYVADVRSGSFPDDSESFHIADDQVEALDLYGG